MSGPTRATRRGALTPAVLAAVAFTALAALASVVFVTARGGLELPVAATTGPAAAVASPGATLAATASPATASPTPSVGPATSTPPTAAPSPASEPTPLPTTPPSPAGPPDPLAALAGCPDHPGCYLYVVRRGDTYSSVSDRFGVGLWVMAALNPEVANRQIIVVGQVLYLGHDPTARLDLCPDGSCHLYPVRSGDTLSTIAGRYGLTVAGIEAINPGLDPSVIVTGQVIRLPLYRPA